MRLGLRLLPIALATLWTSLASAAPLTLEQLDALANYVTCTEACDAGPAVDRQACAAACAPADPADWQTAWEKDGVPPVTRNDLELAQLEVADGGSGTEVCYSPDGRVVVPAALCPDQLCRAVPRCTDADCIQPEESRPLACPDVVCRERPIRDATDCADADGDGVPAWLENATGGTDTVPATFCISHAECGFVETCQYDEEVGASRCAPRLCNGPCTAFHLETVAADDQTVLIQLHYDYSPVPAQVLDLYIEFDEAVLLLADARPLPNLSSFGKELYITQLSNGRLRLVILDPDSEEPILTGPLVELVFQRVAGDTTTVRFVTDDALQREAIAPLQDSPTTQQALQDDALWGAPIIIPDRADAEGHRLLLWYNFDSADDPLAFENVPSEEELCGRVASCINEPDDVERGRIKARLRALQEGSLSASGSITGVTRGGVYFDGETSLLRMPVQVMEPYEAAGQGYSISFWFYTEGNGSNENSDTPQLLYTHNGPDERTRFGLLLEPDGTGTWTLSFFTGDMLDIRDLQRTAVAGGVELRVWHHVAATIDAATGQVLLYFDGLLNAAHQFPAAPPPVSCPGFAMGSEVILHEEGSFLGGRAPEILYFSPQRGPLYQVERMDTNGLASTRVLGDGAHHFQDVDYLPFLNKIAYVSNASGNFEVWVADSDGSNAEQVTLGFGDTERGIFARRPRWAPDGSAFIFESNVYSVPDDHNSGRGYQLYYVQFSPVDGVVAIPLEGGGEATQLDYTALLATQSLGAYQLTRAEGNHFNAWWLTGKAQGGVRGDIVFEGADESLASNVVRRMQIPENIREASSTEVAGLGDSDDEKHLLTATRRIRPGPVPVTTLPMLYQRRSVVYEPATQFAVSVVENSQEASVTLSHEPNGYDDKCWDRNHNDLPPGAGRDADEDRNRDGQYDVNDCYPPDVRTLYVEYDSRKYIPRISPTDLALGQANSVLRPEAQGGVEKRLQISVVETTTGSFLHVEALSPFNALPIPAGTLVTITFTRREAGTPSPAFGLTQRTARSELFYVDLAGTSQPSPVNLAERMEEVTAAAFSPDGNGMMLAGIAQARPTLLRTSSLLTLEGAERVLDLPARIRGMSWTRETRYYPCNWMGGYVHPFNRLVKYALRGGLDDLRVYAGVRDPDAIRSESDLGGERLVVEGRDGPVESLLPACGTSHADCPAFHLCVQGQCQMVECDPDDAYSCTLVGGRCTMRPLSVEQEDPGQSGFDFVCAADCVADAQCFTQACLNGPCGYCDTQSNSCVECRETVEDYGSFQIASIEGCPDRNSFMCDSGSCRTECYSIQDGQSVYRCDPTLEYCRQGRCVSLDWDWTDFAPGSLSGLTETVYEHVPGAIRTVAVGEASNITIKAYGKGDYSHPPEIIVEGKLVAPDGASLYNGNWFRLGRLFIHNRTKQEADGKPLVLHVPHPVTDLRIRLVHTPYENLDGTATGLGLTDKDFCRADVEREAAEHNRPVDYSRCVHRAPGSIQQLGYPMDVPFDDQVAECRRGHAGCPSVNDPLRQYLGNGLPSVLITETKIDGATATIDTNPVCSWEGTLDPVEPGTLRRRKLYYGDISKEISGQRNRYCLANPAACTAPTGLLDFVAKSAGAYGLLNCNYNDPATGALAAIEFTLPPYVQSFTSGAVRETANSCFVEIDPVRREQCYEFIGGDVSIDPWSDATEIFQTLEFSLPRGFAHDRGYTSVPKPKNPLRVRVTGLNGGTLVLANAGETLSLTGSGVVTGQFPTPLAQGRRYSVAVVSQPQPMGNPVYCFIEGTAARGAMSDSPSGVEVPVSCGGVGTVGGSLSGLVQGDVVLRLTAESFVSGNNVRDNGRFDRTLVANGAFSFDTPVPIGAQYALSVARHPQVPPQYCTITGGSGNMVAGGVNNVGVSCVETPPRLLGGTVTGMDPGNSVTLRNSATGETLTVASNGSFAFQHRVRPGQDYLVEVLAHPLAESCTVGGAAGNMPNADVTSVAVNCTNLPTYAVPVRIVGLLGSGLRIRLNGTETIPVNTNGTMTFSTRLLSGATYAVDVAAQPTGPVQSCNVVAGTGVVGNTDVTDVTVICGSPPQENNLHTVGGSVSGLMGGGLRLTLNANSQRVDISRNGAFEFPNVLSEGTDYEVIIARQPTTPPQTCTLSNGTGTIGATNVTNITVACTGASNLRVQFTNGPQSMRGVRAMVFNASGARVGSLKDSAAIAAGGATFDVVAPDDAGQSSPVAASLAAGNYTLLIMLNTDGSVDGNNTPTYEPGDQGVRKTISLAQGSVGTVTVAMNEMVTTIYEPVEVRASGIAADASVSCFFTVATGTRPALPTSSSAGNSVVACTSQNSPCFTFSILAAGNAGVTNTHQPLVPGSYDVTCWYDVGGNNNAPDNSHNAGDRVGFRANITADGPGVLTQQTVVTLDPP
ncbi:MAG: LamG-like jellyroll fold domain-containing protein [Myxococcota bacterium]